ncbi:magnesium transporter [Sphingoaurantiacus capsulatus]|uniref:Magnesium transporter MgtE n=1 Tax=Sphingoaurantiacus capsulatus TaxID=1771310 RepID=A0ABV7X925_9SPHN
MVENVADTPQAPVEDNRLNPMFVDDVVAALEAGDIERVRLLADPLHPADVADLMEQVEAVDRAALAAALGDKLDADAFAEMNDYVRDDLIDALEPQQVGDLVQQLDTDDAVAIIEDLDADDQREVLRSLPADDRAAIEEALSYPEESAGRVMQRELIAVPEHWTIGQVIDFLRENPDLATDFWEIFVVDTGHHPVGTMRLSWVLRTPRKVAVADVMQREQTLIPVDMDQEEVALRFQKYALISAAVTDATGRLVGVITVDDILHIIQEEAGEDILKLSGAGDGDVNEPVFETVKVRVRWLMVNLGTAILASLVIGLFAATIEQMVALAILMPIVASLGGNAGTQTMAVAVRALATNELTESNTSRQIGKEIKVALMNGAVIAIIVGLVAGLYFANAHLGWVIAVAMVGNILVAGLAGVLVPLTLDRFDIDPAVASSVFVTMTTDVMGFFLFLGLAAATGLTPAG